MSEALRLGLSAEDFWRMSPRAVCLLIDARTRRGGKAAKRGAEAQAAPRLAYLPRP